MVYHRRLPSTDVRVQLGVGEQSGHVFDLEGNVAAREPQGHLAALAAVAAAIFRDRVHEAVHAVLALARGRPRRPGPAAALVQLFNLRLQLLQPNQLLALSVVLGHLQSARKKVKKGEEVQ